MQPFENSNVVSMPKRKVTDREIAIALSESSRTSEKHQQEIHAAYDRYVANGWKPILLYKGKKNPVGNNWLSQPARDQEDFVGHNNIGIALGEHSAGLTDIDIDHPDLLEVAPVFLPATPAKFGRYYGKQTQSLAHWLYRSNGNKTFKLAYHGKTIIEVRSTGGQTVFPPSFIFDDKSLWDLDLVCWDGGPKVSAPNINEVPEIDFEYLKSCVTLLFASVQAASYFKKTGFHDGMLAWAGMLAKAGYSEEDTLKSTMWIAEESGQEDRKDREQGVRDTYKKVCAGDYNNDDTRILGINWFRENIPDEKFVSWLSKTFRIKSSVVDDGRPVVRVHANKEVKVVQDTLAAMVKTEKFYTVGGVMTVVDKEEDGMGVRGGARLNSLPDSVSLQSWLTKEIQFVQSNLDKATMQFVDQIVRAPGFLSSELANPFSHRGNVPELTGLTTIPLITPKGRVVDNEHAYDPELKVFFSCSKPYTKMYPDEAVRILREPFVDFPFAGAMVKSYKEGGVGNLEFGRLEGDRELLCGDIGRYHAAAISAVLAAVVRPAISICPAYVITSSQYSDGKSVLSNIISSIVGMEPGTANSPLTRGGNDEEQEKQISSALARGKRVIIYDNHDGEFRSAALTETLTSSQPEFRVLGKSEVRSIPNRSMFVINGVNIVLASDLQTRSILIRLARRDVDPHRKFKHYDVAGWAHNNHASLVSAAISLIEWALQRPDGDWRPSHRFKDWDKLVRRTMLLAFGVDISPPSVEDEDRTLDPVEEAKSQFLLWLLGRWEAGIRSKESKHHFFSRDMAQQVCENTEEESWVNVLSKRAHHPIDQKMGRCLAAIKDVPFESGGKVYVLRAGVWSSKMKYWVEQVEG